MSKKKYAVTDFCWQVKSVLQKISEKSQKTGVETPDLQSKNGKAGLVTVVNMEEFLLWKTWEVNCTEDLFNWLRDGPLMKHDLAGKNQGLLSRFLRTVIPKFTLVSKNKGNVGHMIWLS